MRKTTTPTDIWIEKNLLTYELAKGLQSVGYDEPCIAFATDEYKDVILTNRSKLAKDINLPTSPVNVPTYQEAFEWLEKKKISCVFEPSVDYDDRKLNYDETHENVEYKFDGYTWSIYPYHFTENDGYSWFFAQDRITAYRNAIEKSIEYLKQRQ